MLKDLIMQILGKEKVPKQKSGKKIDEKKYKYFKFKPLHNGNDRCETVIVLRDSKLDDYKKEVKLLKLPGSSKEVAYLKSVWNKNFPNQAWE